MAQGLNWEPIGFGICDATAADETYFVFEANILDDLSTEGVIKGHTPGGRHFTTYDERDWPLIEDYIPREEWPPAIEGSKLPHWNAQDPVLKATTAEVYGAAADQMRASQAAITVYTTPNCQGCELTKKQLAKAGLQFNTVDLSTQPELVEQFKRQGLLAAPIIEAPDGSRTAGFRPDRIKSLIDAGRSTQTATQAPATATPPPAPSQARRQAQQTPRRTL